jgi:flagellar biosynthetic protein FliO
MFDDRRSFLADERTQVAPSAPSAIGLLVRTLGALLLIIGLIVAAGWALKRFGGARFGLPRQDAPDLTLLATVALGDRRSIAAVRFGGRTLLLGSTAQSITLLATQEHVSAPSTPPVRSVADLLQATTEPAFDHALSSAEQRFAYVRQAEREDGGPA